jgi:hypothetical protein
VTVKTDWAQTHSFIVEVTRLGFQYDAYTLTTSMKTEPGQFNGTSLGYGLDDRGFESHQGLGIFLFTTASRPALGLTQSPIEWVPGVVSLGVKRSGREADYSPPSSAEVKNVWSYISTPPIRLQEAQGQLYLHLLAAKLS